MDKKTRKAIEAVIRDIEENGLEDMQPLPDTDRDNPEVLRERCSDLLRILTACVIANGGKITFGRDVSRASMFQRPVVDYDAETGNITVEHRTVIYGERPWHSIFATEQP